MKKLIYLLFLLPLALLGSCSDDDDLPNVDLTISFDNVAADGSVIYVVKGEPFEVTSVSVKGIGSKALVTSVTYYWDYLCLGTLPVAPFCYKFGTDYTHTGNHLLGMTIEVAQEGKSLGFTGALYHVKVVDSVDDLPEGKTLGPLTIDYSGKTED